MTQYIRFNFLVLIILLLHVQFRFFLLLYKAWSASTMSCRLESSDISNWAGFLISIVYSSQLFMETHGDIPTPNLK